MTGPTFLYDDAYITLASAQALWTGGDSHYPDVSPLTGLTSPVHVIVVALLVRVMPPEWALLASCVLGATLYAAGLAYLARASGCSRLEAAGLVAAGLGVGTLSQQLANGLETSWALAGTAWLLAFAEARKPGPMGAVAGTLPFIRPELGILAVVFVLFEARHGRQSFLRAVGAGIAAGMPWLILLWSITGSPLPTSLRAKTDWYGETCWTWARRLATVGRGLGAWLLSGSVLAIGLLGVVRNSRVRLAAAVAVTTLVLWSLNVPSVLYAYQRHRYYAPFSVVLLAGIAALPTRARKALLALAIVVAVVNVAAVLRLEPQAIAQADRIRREEAADLRATGARRVLIHDAGYLAWSDSAPLFIDMVGLKSATAAAANRAWTGPTCGARRADAVQALAASTQPDHLVIWQPWDDYFGVTSALEASGWSVDREATVTAPEPIYIYRLSRPPR